MNNFLGKSGQVVLLVLFFISSFAQAQIIKPPKWTVSIESENLKVGEEAKLVFKAEIPAGWYIYATDFDPDLGPIIASLALEKSSAFELKGGLGKNY